MENIDKYYLSKGMVLGVLFLFIGMSVIPSAIGITVDIYNSRICNWDGNILYVGGTGSGNYSSIQDAINDASNGDAVFVYSGYYYETLYINKSINLVGEDKNSTIIDGCGDGEVIQNTMVNCVGIFDFTVRNGSYGIGLYSCDDTTIKGNIIQNNRYAGIWLDSSSNNTLCDNLIQNVGFYGIWMDYCSDRNVVKENTIKDNNNGIYIASSYGNNIYHNNLIGNSLHASFDDAYNNRWNENYWDDWVGLKCKLLRMLPKCIRGHVGKIPWFNFDWHPLKQQYNKCFNSKPYISFNSILYVGGNSEGNYTNIQDAIDNAHTGDTIFVYSGIYYENPEVHRSVNLVGEDRDNTIVDGRGMGSVFEVTANQVNIRGFAVRNGGYGIVLYSVSQSSIYDNIIRDNKYDGIWLDFSSNNTIRNNIIQDHKYNGILLSYKSNDNIIEENTIKANGYGINIANSSKNNIHCNNFVNNGRHAFFAFSRYTTWNKNYWNRPRLLPKPIFGKMAFSGRKFTWLNFDWCPAIKPYEI